VGKGCGRVNTVQILCTCVCKWKTDTCGNCFKNGGEVVKENEGGDEFEYDIFDIS
jgi:hypothetical protein